MIYRQKRIPIYNLLIPVKQCFSFCTKDYDEKNRYKMYEHIIQLNDIKLFGLHTDT